MAEQNAMDAAIAAAQSATSTAVAPAQTTAVAAATAGVPRPISMETAAAGSIPIDKWLKVTEDGFKTDESGLITGKIRCALNMVEGVGFQIALSAKAGNPAQYIKTFDSVTEATSGRMWGDALAELRLIDSKVRPYYSATVGLTVLEEVKDVKGTVALPVDTVIGFSTSTTNWNEWYAFHKKVEAEGNLGQEVVVDLVAIPKKNAKGNVWGIIGFELIGLNAHE